MKIVTVRMREPLLLGRALDTVTSISDGQQFEGCNIELSFYSDMFFKVHFPATTRRSAYSQFLPWSNVGTAMLDETPEESIVDTLVEHSEWEEKSALQASVGKRGRPKKVNAD